MFNPAVFENSRSDGHGVLEIVATPVQEQRPPRRFVPLQETRLTGVVAGPLAALTLTQHFGFSDAVSDKIIEAVYRFPLPGDAAIQGVRVRFGSVEIVAELQEREQAEAEYAEAKEAGRQAALLTREAADVFSLQVAGIRPEEPVVVTSRYVQLARAHDLGWALRIPLTTAPRYVREDERGSRPAEGQPHAVSLDPGHRFSLDLRVEGPVTVTSPTHALVTAPAKDAVAVALAQGSVLPNSDCVLLFMPEQQAERPMLTLFVHPDGEAEPNAAGGANPDLYFLAQVAPPSQLQPGAGVSREVTLLVDHSGSMRGAKWSSADWAVERFLGDLSPTDYFALCLFHNNAKWFAAEQRQATETTVTAAVEWLNSSRDSGGTNLGAALEEGLGVPRVAGDFARNLLVMTDAAVTDTGRVLRLADEESQRAERRRISVLCIDAAPNDYLSTELAERGGGVAKFLTSSPQAEDITTALDEVLTAWAEPVLADLRVAVNCSKLESAQRRVCNAGSAWPAIELGDLPAGRTLWVAGRVQPPADGSATIVRLESAGGEILAEVNLTVSGAVTEAGSALKALFGARRVNGLEYLINARYTPEELADQLARLGYAVPEALAAAPAQLYAENAAAESRKLLRDLLVQEALHYGLPSSETAFVATRMERGEPVEERVVVANALPEGWSQESAAGPRAFSAPARGLPGADAYLGAAAGGPAAMPRPAMAMSLGGPMGAEPAPSKRGAEKWVTLYSGSPEGDSDVLLFDSERQAELLPSRTTLLGIRMHFQAGPPSAEQLGRSAVLLIFVGDLALPSAKVRVADLVRYSERPLNLQRTPDQTVRVVLHDPDVTMRSLQFDVAVRTA